ncbi:MAG: hypothetical protein ABEJ42_10395 [Halobacteriaceae archaeon]
MHRTTIAVLLLAGLVALAGCGGQSTSAPTTATQTTPTDRHGDPRGGSTASPGTTAVPTTATPTGTPTSTTPLPPGIEIPFPGNYGPEGVPGGGSIISTHTAALQNTSYTVTYRRGTGAQAGTLQINLSSGRVYANVTWAGKPVELIVRDGLDYRKYVVNGSLAYNSGNVTPGQLRRQLSLRTLGAITVNNYSYRNTTTYDGVTVHHYEIVEINRSISRLDPSNFTSTSGHLYVDERGRVRDFRWNASHTRTNFTYRYTLSRVGETTVTDPWWLPVAMNRTGS